MICHGIYYYAVSYEKNCKTQVLVWVRKTITQKTETHVQIFGMTICDTWGDGRRRSVNTCQGFLYNLITPFIILKLDENYGLFNFPLHLCSRVLYIYILISMEVFLIKFLGHVHGRHSTKREFSILLLCTQRKHNIIFFCFYRHGCLTKRKRNRMNDNSENVMPFVFL